MTAPLRPTRYTESEVNFAWAGARAIVGVGVMAVAPWGYGTVLGGYLTYQGGAKIVEVLSNTLRQRPWSMANVISGIWQHVWPNNTILTETSRATFAEKGWKAAVGGAFGYAASAVTGGWGMTVAGALAGYIYGDMSGRTARVEQARPAQAAGADNRPSPVFDTRIQLPDGRGWTTVGELYEGLVQARQPRNEAMESAFLLALSQYGQRFSGAMTEELRTRTLYHPDFSAETLRGILQDAVDKINDLQQQRRRASFGSTQESPRTNPFSSAGRSARF